jgi:surface antigen
MFTHARKLTAAALIVSLAGTTALTGCDTIERETGFNRSTQTGAAGGAAFGGIVAALASANPAWIAASVILGGLTGGAIGKYLGEHDARQSAQNHYSALENLREGQTSSWRDPNTGNHGSTTVQSSFTARDGALCKRFTESIHTPKKEVTESGTACRSSSGDWKLRAA